MVNDCGTSAKYNDNVNDRGRGFFALKMWEICIFEAANPKLLIVQIGLDHLLRGIAATFLLGIFTFAIEPPLANWTRYTAISTLRTNSHKTQQVAELELCPVLQH